MTCECCSLVKASTGLYDRSAFYHAALVVVNRDCDMTQNKRRSIRTLHIATDAILVSSCWVLAYFIRQSFSAKLGVSLSSFSLYIQVLPLIVLTWLLSCWFFGLYQRARRTTGLEQIQNLVKSTMLGWLLTTAAAFYFKEYHLGRTVVLLSGLLNLVVLSVNWYLFFRWERRAAMEHTDEVRALIVGANPNGIRLLQKLEEHPEHSYRTIGFLDPSAKEGLKEYGNRPILGGLEELRNVMEEHAIDEVIVALPNLGYKVVFPLVLACEDLDVGFWILNKDFEALNRNRSDIPNIDGLPL